MALRNLNLNLGAAVDTHAPLSQLQQQLVLATEADRRFRGMDFQLHVDSVELRDCDCAHGSGGGGGGGGLGRLSSRTSLYVRACLLCSKDVAEQLQQSASQSASQSEVLSSCCTGKTRAQYGPQVHARPTAGFVAARGGGEGGGEGGEGESEGGGHQPQPHLHLQKGLPGGKPVRRTMVASFGGAGAGTNADAIEFHIGPRSGLRLRFEVWCSGVLAVLWGDSLLSASNDLLLPPQLAHIGEEKALRNTVRLKGVGATISFRLYFTVKGGR
jgi:hypothetical protein